MQEILLKFDGYWIDAYKAEIPHEAGIYCVYACEPMAADKIVVLRELIYIGASDDVNVSIASADDECVSAWRSRLQEAETFCYSIASVGQDMRDCAVSAMIYHHRPSCNRIESEFSFDDTRLEIVGEHELLDDSFVADSKVQAVVGN